MRILILIFLLIQLSGCCVKATRDGDTLILNGWGAKSAKWSDGAEITKEEPIRVPNIMSTGG